MSAVPNPTADLDRRDLLIGAGVAGLGVVAAFSGSGRDLSTFALHAVVALVVGAAVACFRRAPALALGLVWFDAGIYVLFGPTTDVVLLAVLVVAYGTARYGSTGVVWASGLSIPLGVGVLLYERGYYPTVYPELGSVFGAVLSLVPVIAMIALAAPWIVGLLLRSQDISRRSSQREEVARTDRDTAVEARAQAQQIAELRERQNRLARDVHDVVGHSLTVILAQAEAAKYVPEDQPERVRESMDAIAAAARESLHDVRQVLASSDETQPVAAGPRDTLDSLVAGVRASGADVRSRVDGSPRPLPPEIDSVAYRTLQEMLTNALKHGDRSAPVHVEQHWDGELRLEVRNDLPAQSSPDSAKPDSADPGRGLEGMRARLESVGGRLDVRRREGGPAATYTATAWLPVRG